jgi:predicted dehydrogenase
LNTVDQAHVIVIGAGSVGRRHGRNLSSLGCRISAVDPRPDRLEEFEREVELIGGYESLNEGLSVDGLSGAVIASPPSAHVPQAMAVLDAGLPLLLEKPVAPHLDEAMLLRNRVKSGGGSVLVGYTWRWWPPLRRARELLEQGVIGRVIHAHCRMSSHLADWHPWEPYQDFFMSSADLGGGALLDESHWIDVAMWLFGTPQWVCARIGKLSTLEIETDDNVDMVLGFEGGPQVVIHLDLYARPHEKSLCFVGENGTLLWSEAPNRVAFSRDATGAWNEESFNCQRNEMFLGVAEEFLSILHGQAPRSCTVESGVAVLRVVEAARESNLTGRVLQIQD